MYCDSITEGQRNLFVMKILNIHVYVTNAHPATELIKSAVCYGATCLLQSYVSAQHFECPRACDYIKNTHYYVQHYAHGHK